MIRPPRLHLGREGTASRLELFFDLAYVLVIMQLAIAFVDDLSWLGLAKLAGLFVAIWFSWVGYTLYANRFDTDDLIFRLAKLLATGAIAGCAASAADAVGSTAIPFAVCYLASRLILFGLYLRAWRALPDARPTINVYLTVIGLSSVLWAISIATPGDIRYLLWGVAVAIDAVGPALATLRRDKLPLHMEHLPERFALLVILVLGEAVGGGVRGVHEAHWAAASVAVAAVGFSVAGALWWIYFDVGARDSANELQDAEEDSPPEKEAVDERHDLFVYGHLPTTFGVVLAGVGIEELVLHPNDPVPAAYGWLLASGLGLFLAGVAMILGGTQRSWRAVWPWPIVAIPVVLAGTLVPATALPLTVGYAVALIVLAIEGTRRSRR
jgi:low temperature requirement protein LtrA